MLKQETQTPMGGWPKDAEEKEIGRFQQLVIDQDAEGTLLFIANTIGWTREQILVYIAHFRREIRSGQKHGYYRQKVVWGRKPLES